MAACIVVWDDEQRLCCPLSFDPDCDGALGYGDGPIALFADRKQAQKAIRISKAFAKLNREQGKPANEDFLGESAKCLQIRPVAGINS